MKLDNAIESEQITDFYKSRCTNDIKMILNLSLTLKPIKPIN